jgi:hypothetical protein
VLKETGPEQQKEWCHREIYERLNMPEISLMRTDCPDQYIEAQKQKLVEVERGL